MPSIALPRRLLSALLACATLWASLLPAQADEIRIVTEELPPYNMTVEGQVTGMSTEVVRAVLEEAGLTGRIEVMPWARAYDLALNVENVMIYSISHTPERDPLFQWVGAIAPSHWYLYSLADRPLKLTSLADARGHQIATVKDDVGEQYLLGKGFVMGKELQSSSKYEHNYRKLRVEHVDLWISDELNARYLVHQNGDDPNTQLIQSLPLDDLTNTDGLGIAMSLKTPPATVARAREALARIHANGVYDAIIHKWMTGAAKN